MALIDMGAQVSSISSGFCKWMALKVNPLDRLLKLEDPGRATTPYLGYVVVNLQIPGKRGYNKDVMLLVILTMIYAEKVPVMVGSKIIDRAMGIIMKEELARKPQPGGRPTSVQSCLRHSSYPSNVQGGWGDLGRGHPFQQPLTPLHIEILPG